MLQFNSGYLRSIANVTARTTITLRFIIKHPATVSSGTIWEAQATAASGEDPGIYYGTNVIRIVNASGSTDDADYWTFPVTANAWNDIAISYQVNASTTPVVYINGVAATVTHTQTTTGLGSMKDGPWIIGSGLPTDCYLDGFAWWSDNLSAANLSNLTIARIHDMPLWISPSTLVDFLGMDPPLGSTWDTLDSIAPDADVANTWSAGTYANLLADDGSYLVANKADDGETYTCSFGTVTLAKTIAFLRSTLVGKSDDVAQASYYLTLGDGTNLTTGTTAFTSSDSTYTQDVVTACSQSNLDGLKANIVAAATMGKDDELSFDYLKVELGYSDSGVWGKKAGTIFMPTVAGGIASVGLSGPGWGY